MSEKVTLADALSNVDVLDELPLPDEQPCIEAQPCSIVYQVVYSNKYDVNNMQKLVIWGSSKFYGVQT